MKSNNLTVSQLASLTRSDRVMVKLPGIAIANVSLSHKACQVYAVLKSIDTPEGILSQIPA